MGILSKKRKQPRIVKKRKGKGQKKINIKEVDPHIRVINLMLIFASYRNIGT